MSLEVSIRTPDDEEDPTFTLITAVVHDTRHPAHQGVFGYISDRSGDTAFLWLTSVAVEHRPEVPLGERRRLALAAVRDAPLARWESAARAHILQSRGLREITREEAVEAVLAFAEQTGPEGLVNRLYPELKSSEKPSDVRKRKGLLHLADVAQEYEFLVRQGTPDPAAAIARRRDAKPSTVRSWLHRARQAGLLAVTSQQSREVVANLPGEVVPVKDIQDAEEE